MSSPCLSSLICQEKSYQFYDLKALEKRFPQAAKLPKVLKILLENLLRHSDGTPYAEARIESLATWTDHQKGSEILYYPTRVLMQDMTGVPALVDLAAMRDVMKEQGLDPKKINPIKPVDLVVDHSAMVDFYGTAQAFQKNQALEFERNRERYAFLKWGQKSFDNLRIIPPGMGICHQINLEHLSRVVWEEDLNGSPLLFPDTVVGMDSHTPMVAGLGVLAWGVGGIEAESVMLGQPISIRIPEVIGFHLEGSLKEGVTATDLVLYITELLRNESVVGKFVEFYGPGVAELSLANRATISNMSPEFGATCAYFPVDNETLEYLTLTARSESQVACVKTYTQRQGLWRDEAEVIFSKTLSLNLESIEASVAGPKRPQDRLSLRGMKQSSMHNESLPVKGADFDLKEHHVVLAAITSCTNTSNPSVMIAAGLLAQSALEKGLKIPPWVKTSLAPGSKVVSDYLESAGLQKAFDALGFNLVGYGCTTCIGNSGPLPENIIQCIESHDLNVSSVLSGNRNFEGRINPHIQSNYLASPPLVVAYALAGTTNIDLSTDPLGYDAQNTPVYLQDIWPKNLKTQQVIKENLKPSLFQKRYEKILEGTEEWQALRVEKSDVFQWDEDSTYIKKPPFFHPPNGRHSIGGARILALFGDSITTDHISPAGFIPEDTPAGIYLKEAGIFPKDFNSYGSRRGNHEVMMRGGFANIRIKNQLNPEKSGGYTLIFPEEKPMSIFEAAQHYQHTNTPLIILAGKEYGTGSSRDWAAKAPHLLGVDAIIAESFERIHRSNLIGMGILPLEFEEGAGWQSLGITGDETISISGINQTLKPGCQLAVSLKSPNQTTNTFSVHCRIDTPMELKYWESGGILPYVLKKLST